MHNHDVPANVIDCSTLNSLLSLSLTLSLSRVYLLAKGTWN